MGPGCIWLVCSILQVLDVVGALSRADGPEIAIVGAGIGGSSAAHYIRQMFGDNVSITVFESGEVGGRLRTVKMAGLDYEIGGTIIHPENRLMVQLTEEMGLTPNPRLSKKAGFTLHDRNGILLKHDTDSWPFVFQLLWRYGIFDVVRLKYFTSTLLENFSQIYHHLDKKTTMENPAELLRAMSPDPLQRPEEMLDEISITLQERLLKHGFGEQIVQETVSAAVKVNYGSTPQEIHSFAGAVALAGAADGLWNIRGGNQLLAERLIQRSGAKLRSSRVRTIRRGSDERYELVATPTTLMERNRLLVEAANFESDEELLSEEVSDMFDIVVVAAPQTEKKGLIRFEGITPPALGETFHRTVATLVKGDPNPGYFGFKSKEEVSEINIFISPESNLSSFARNFPADRTEDQREFPNVWKIFSHLPLSEQQLDEMFLFRDEVVVADWLAYPEYAEVDKDSLGSFRLEENLYYVSPIELCASAMEMSVISAKNIANMAFEEWTRGRPTKSNSDTKIPDEL